MVVRSPVTSFKRYAVRAALLPTVLLIALAGVLVWQIQGLLSAAAYVEHTDQVITNASRLLRLHVDMETGLRGFMLTHERLFLEPYDRGMQRVPEVMEAERDALADAPDQLKALRDIDADSARWMAYAKETIARQDTYQGTDPVDRVALGKRLMDAVRGRFDALVASVEKLRADRDTAARRTARRGAWTACIGVLGVGAILAVASRRDLRRLSKTYEEALTTAKELTADLERRVDQRTAELTDANAELGAFAYSISHDLRAPLRHISGFADLLKRSAGKSLIPDDAENLDTIRDTAVLAGRMVDDLLAFSRIGRAELRKEPVDVRELVEKVRRELEPETKGRSIEWVIDDLPDTVGDASLLKLVVSNLLSNAIKYTSKKPDAKIEFFSAPGEDGQTTYVVRDNGVGFDMSYAHKLFGVFQRLHRAEEYEGTGIGLANVRRIIVRHGGRTWAEGRPGDGATFYFSLPTKA